MSGKTLIIDDILEPDNLACSISDKWLTWENLRAVKVTEWTEVQRYIFATDTTQTSNSKLPWSNKTTLPKLCQIRDNLYANYMASMFPKRKWLVWEGDTKDDNSVEKRKAIESYMEWVVDRNEFYDEMSKLVLDYIDYGNCFVMTDWVDQRVQTEDKLQVGYVGPMVRRISPLDIVFNPTAPSFAESPKIVRSLVSIGEVKEILSRLSADDNEKEDAQALYDYLVKTRQHVGEHPGPAFTKNEIYNISGFSSYANYLESNYAEVLTFYGDIYNEDTKEFQRNQVIKVVDRHKLLSQVTNPSFFGKAPIFHCGWRIRPDNLWAMGPLDNLVGMQYRIDHLENMKADVFDLIAYPPIKITGYVESFNWGPMEHIYVGDDGNVELTSPDVAALQADNQIAILEQKMEEMAGSPKEAMGFRTPGEKTKYEVERLENAANRIFQNKIGQFERHITENGMNASLELARRHMTDALVKVFDPEFSVETFLQLTPEDITGVGRIRPVAARHFAEQSLMVQNLNNFFSSAAYQAVAPHFSSIGLARIWEDLLDLEDFNIVQPFVALSEQADAQRIVQAAQEQLAVEQQTSSGLGGDFDQASGGGLGQAPAAGAPGGIQGPGQGVGAR